MTELLPGFALLGLPFILALASTFVVARFLQGRRPAMHRLLKIVLATLAGVVTPVAFLLSWHWIEAARRAAAGDTSDWMGPAVILIYGFPLFFASWIACAIIAYSMTRKPA